MLNVKKLVLGAAVLAIMAPLSACGDHDEYRTQDGTKVEVDRDMTETNVETERETAR